MTADLSPAAPEKIEVDGASGLVYRDAPAWNGARTVAVGGFSAVDEAAGARLLGVIAAQARAEGFQALIGPMDGDTWHRYRVVGDSDGSPPFFLEPTSGPHDRAAFLTAGFRPISSYVSARARVADALGVRGLAVSGVSVTAWDGRDAGELIGGLFDLSRRAFTRNAFYKPLSRDGFLKLYAPLMPAIDPRLVFFARRGGDLVGYLFALPDRLQGATPDTAIIKTYASSLPGAGQMLSAAAHRAMRDLGYRNVIHALMHVDNRSRAASGRYGAAIFRRYDLMGLDLTASA